MDANSLNRRPLGFTSSQTRRTILLEKMFINPKRAVVFKLSEGMEVHKELEEKFKFENRMEYALTAN